MTDGQARAGGFEAAGARQAAEMRAGPVTVSAGGSDPDATPVRSFVEPTVRVR